MPHTPFPGCSALATLALASVMILAAGGTGRSEPASAAPAKASTTAPAPAKPAADAAERSRTMAVGLVWDERYLAHKQAGHPERPERLTAIRQGLEEAGLWNRLVRIQPYAATDEMLERVHSKQHIQRIRREASGKDLAHLDADTYAGPGSWDAALLAAGGVSAATDAVMKGQVRSAFCAVRPPGHHASRDRAMGFCLFNNVAVGARYVQAAHGIRRVLIVDWDVHHGNGTQDTFYRDGTVMYVSIHESPLYPGTGAADEKGDGPGAGRIRNFPLPPGAGDKEFLAALQEGLKAAEEFKPEFVFISCGFDAHKDDPLGGLKRTDEGYAEGTRRVRAFADRFASGRIVSVLEGGYSLDALRNAAAAHVAALMAP
jgi:acetoin utilization deacetylase AcuC-like enzyme